MAQYDIMFVSGRSKRFSLVSKKLVVTQSINCGADPTEMQLHPMPLCSVPAPVIKALIKCLLMYLDCESGCNQVKQN